MNAIMPGLGLALTAAAKQDGPLTLPTSEVFGPVWQGEGPHTGRVCSFVRLGLCNLACAWCDTPYTWDRTRFDVDAECPPTDVEVIRAHLLKAGASLVILSGGEPLMHQGTDALRELVTGSMFEWHVETNGTIRPMAWLADTVTHFTVSPKLITDDPVKKRLKPGALAAFAELAQQGRAIFKIVCATPQDVAAADELFNDYDLPEAARWVMPEGVTADAVLAGARAIADAATERRLNLSLRQHTLMYGTERAR